MSPNEIKALRAELRCTLRELGESIDVDQKTIIAWEAGTLFPTKKHVTRLEALGKTGGAAIVRKVRGEVTPMQALADAKVWGALRKILVHKKFRDEVLRLAAEYPDPIE